MQITLRELPRGRGGGNMSDKEYAVEYAVEYAKDNVKNAESRLRESKKNLEEGYNYENQAR